MTPSDLSFSQRIAQRTVNLAIGGALRLALMLPYRTRVASIGWLVSRVVAPLAGYTRRIRENLALAWPELSPEEVRRLEVAVPENLGRSMIEWYSGPEFRARMKTGSFEGPGAAALTEACETGRPVVVVTAHFGNFDAGRALAAVRYGNVGALYRPLQNVYFNRHYEAALESIASPIFPRNRRGLVEMMRFLRDGNVLAVVADQHVSQGAPLTFFGQRAWTTTSPAEMALKHDALIVPVFGIRAEDGLSFRVLVDAPLPHTTPEEMMQQFNDGLEALIREHPEQWFWVHRRWKDIG